MPDEEHAAVINGSIDKGIETLTKPGMEDMIRQAAKNREDNLPVEFHHSKNKINSLVERARGILNGETNPNEVGIAGQGNRGSEANVTGAEAAGAGQNQGKNPEQKLKAFSPPKNNYQVEITDANGNTETRTMQALSRKALFKQIMKDGDVRQAHILSEARPEVGEPFQVAPKERPTGNPEDDNAIRAGGGVPAELCSREQTRLECSIIRNNIRIQST